MPDKTQTMRVVFRVAALLATPTAAFAAAPSGTAVAVVQSSEATGTTGARQLVARGPVYMGDTIRTGARGEAQILLADDTRLVVGPNSSMVVDAFVFDGGGRAKEVALNAVRGAFRFITGSSRKSAYRIKTPTATIGVRGTQFDFSIDRRGQLNFALFEGRARICSNGGRCTVVSGACSVAVVPRNGTARRLPAGGERTRLLTTMFPYVASQRGLRRAFRVDTASCRIRKADIFQPGAPAQGFARRAARGFFAPSATDPGVTVDPGAITGSIRNRNGFADNTNPGRGSFNNNASGGGTHNPGGSGGGGSSGGGGGGSSGGGGGGSSGGGGGNGGGNGNGNANGHNK